MKSDTEETIELEQLAKLALSASWAHGLIAQLVIAQLVVGSDPKNANFL